MFKNYIINVTFCNVFFWRKGKNYKNRVESCKCDHKLTLSKKTIMQGTLLCWVFVVLYIFPTFPIYTFILKTLLHRVFFPYFHNKQKQYRTCKSDNRTLALSGAPQMLMNVEQLRELSIYTVNITTFPPKVIKLAPILH